jgi:hypothetical protein
VTASYFFAAGLQILNFFSACPIFRHTDHQNFAFNPGGLTDENVPSLTVTDRKYYCLAIMQLGHILFYFNIKYSGDILTVFFVPIGTVPVKVSGYGTLTDRLVN